jgi:hypothetical protein
MGFLEKTSSDAKFLMEIYSERVLGYDSDALNAIIGTLNVMSGNSPPTYHIWGVPFTITQEPSDQRLISLGISPSSPTDTYVTVALAWFLIERSSRSRRRRRGFPSWSSLGWVGRIKHHFQELELKPAFMIRYWSGRRYRGLDSATCSLDYTASLSGPHRSQYLEITADIVQVNLSQRQMSSGHVYFFKPPFFRLNESRAWKHGHLNGLNSGPFIYPYWDDETELDIRLPILCTAPTMTYGDTGSNDLINPLKSFSLLFQKRAEHYERVGACQFIVYYTDAHGRWHTDDNLEIWEYTPFGQKDCWDQVAKRRTFIVS